jgi:NIMA (never in mitosis gene a)-related kinase
VTAVTLLIIFSPDSDGVSAHHIQAPEILKEERYNEKSDIWSLGCLIYELAMLRPPFQSSNTLALALRIQKGQYDPIDSSYSAELSRAIKFV